MPLLVVGLLVGTLITGRVSTEQVTNGGTGSSLPGSCVVGSIFVTTVNPALSICSAVNTWTTLPTSAGAGGGDPVPTGAILLVASGSCPTGYAEETALNGKLPLGTLTANGDLGTTGGADTLTPAGTISAPTLTMNSYTPAGTNSGGAVSAHAGANVTSTFTGSALGTHAHELPFQIPTTTTTRQLAAATFGTGTSRAATGVSAAGVANTTSAAVALSQAVSAGTPAGTIANTITQPSAHTFTQPVFSGTPSTITGSVSAPSFTGSSADNRSAFVKTLYCKKT